MTNANTNEVPKGHFRRLWFLYTLLILSLGFSAYLWFGKDMALKKQSEKFEQEKVMLMEEAQEAFNSNSRLHLTMMMKTFAWAVRGELTRGNNEQVDQFFGELVKQNNFEEVSLVDEEGTIFLSSNKKNEGSELTANYAESVLNIEDIRFFDEVGKEIIAAPIMAMTKKIGTLVVIHRKEVFQPEAKIDLTKEN